MAEAVSLTQSTRATPTLLPLKTVPPAPRADALLRPDLRAMLAEARLQSATLVVAPAGYGKTTLLAQWAAELDRTGAMVNWISLDSGDRDPSLLLAYLVRAFQSSFPNIGQQAWRVLHSAADFQRDWPLVAGALFSDLQAELTVPTFLFLDDFHLIADGPITSQLLGYLLRAAPPSLHIVISSRRPVTIAPLPRLRAEGMLLELNQDDLSLTTLEVRALLERQQVDLTEEDLALLLARTEGWALSIQLIARTLARLPVERRSNYVHMLDVNQESLFEYLASEVIADLPPDLLNFLAFAALPEQFDAPLLAEVMQRRDIDEFISRVLQLGLPLTTVDEGTRETGMRLYRFHPLWRRLLLRHARTTLSDDVRIQAQRGIGRVLERRGNLERALQHYAAVEDMAELARALRERAWPLINTPQRDTVRRWLDYLPAIWRVDDPELLHMWGWSHFAIMPEQAANAISESARLYREQGLYGREMRALSDVAALLFWEDRPGDPRAATLRDNRDVISGNLDHNDSFAAICVRAVRSANRVRDAWARGAALVSVVALLYSQGRYAAAQRVATHAARHPRSAFWQWLLALIVSSISIQQGYPAAALTTLNEALHSPQIDRDDRMRQHLLRQKAQALYQLGEDAEALELARSTHRRLSDYYNDGVVGTSAALLALLLLEHGSFEEASTYLARARQVAHRTGAVALLGRVEVLETLHMLHAGQFEQAAVRAADLLRQSRNEEQQSSVQAAILGPSEYWLRLLLLVTLGESGDTARAFDLLAELIAQMQARSDGLFLVAAILYRAALAERLGDAETAAALLTQGWNLAEELEVVFLPFLPSDVLSGLVATGIRSGLGPAATSSVLRRQLREKAIDLLVDLAADRTPTVRAHAATLLGDLGAVLAYPVLRSLLKDRSQPVRTAAESALERLVYRPVYQLRIRTLGAFNVWRGEDEVRDRDWRSVKARQLLQLLLVERGRMLPRERIMDTLWPGLESEAAANNLRVTISRLTRALEPGRPEGAPNYYIIQQGDTYGFNISADHRLDATDFADAVNDGRNAQQNGNLEEAVSSYRRAIGLYGGTFLPDSLYEDWSVVERERLALLFCDAALRLGGLLLDQGMPHEAIGLAWRVLEHDQAQEDAYRLLMRAHAALGERSTALRLYTRCVAALREELGVDPLPETVELYEELKL